MKSTYFGETNSNNSERNVWIQKGDWFFLLDKWMQFVLSTVAKGIN